MELYLEKYPPLLTVCQVAEILGVCQNSIRKAITNGSIPCIRIGRTIKIPKDRLIDFIENV